jgi:hypothetical protein
MSIRKKSTTSSAPKKPARAKTELPKGAPSTPDAMPPEVVEFITAIDEYKRKHQRPFPNWSEVLEIVKALGYSRE